MGFGSSKRRKHSKPGQTTLRAFHFRIEANNEQADALRATLDLAWELRNDLATTLETNRQEARALKQQGQTPRYLSASEMVQSVASDQLHPKFSALHSQVRQNLSLRIVEGQQRWLEALKKGNNSVRPPAPTARKRFRSITYPQYGTAARITDGRLHLSKLGEFRVIGWRKMVGAKKSITLKWKEGHWWAIVMCEAQESDVCRPYAEVVDCLPDAGLDPGLAAVLTDSHGNAYETPKPIKAAQGKLRRIQRNVSRKFEARRKAHAMALAAARAATGSSAPVADGLVPSLPTIPYSNRLRRGIRKLARAHTKVERVRDDAAKKNARRIERRFRRVAVEEHGLVFMQRNRCTAKAASDVAIGKQKQALKSALGKGRYFEASNRRPEGGNSQTCLCGAAAPKALSERQHHCPACGLFGPRDQVSAIICQHETFGTLPSVSFSSPGLGELEHAARLLEQGRGEGKGLRGESRLAERSAKTATEPSAKRLAPGRSASRTTAGAAKAASAGDKTADHAGLARSCSAESQSLDAQHAPPSLLPDGSSWVPPRSPLLQVGE